MEACHKCGGCEHHLMGSVMKVPPYARGGGEVDAQRYNALSAEFLLCIQCSVRPVFRVMHRQEGLSGYCEALR